MEIFYNELSNLPLASNNEESKQRIISLLETLKTLRDYGINIMRTHDGFYAEQLSENYSFSNFFGDPSVSIDLKILLRTIVANPYIEDADSHEAELFVTNTFTTQNHLGEIIHPEGLASAYIFQSPAISVGIYKYWQNEVLPLVITSGDTHRIITNESILNIYSVASIRGVSFQNWFRQLNQPFQLNSEENIYKIFPASQFYFEPKAINDIISWFYDDRRYLIRVKELIEDIIDNPFVGGKGKTEPLSGTDGKASKRIVKKDRIIYTYSKDKITIHQCRGHYGDK